MPRSISRVRFFNKPAEILKALIIMLILVKIILAYTPSCILIGKKILNPLLLSLLQDIRLRQAVFQST